MKDPTPSERPPLFGAPGTPTVQDGKNESSDLRISEHFGVQTVGVHLWYLHYISQSDLDDRSLDSIADFRPGTRGLPPLESISRKALTIGSQII